MPTDAGMFEAFYASFAQHPLLLWLGAVAAFAYCATAAGVHPSTRRYTLALCGLSVLDATMTTQPIPGIGAVSGQTATFISLFFVLAGDLRFLFFVESATDDGRMTFDSKKLGVALGLMVIVPLGSQFAMSLVPEASNTPRLLFFVYEVMFVALTLALLRWHPNARAVPWVRNVSWYVVGYYSLWATADAIILLSGADIGFLLRVVPNLLYYGGLMAFIAATSRESRSLGVGPNQVAETIGVSSE